jgi:hypothetical protein
MFYSDADATTGPVGIDDEVGEESLPQLSSAGIWMPRRVAAACADS